jgi:hypothetical protein
VSASVDVQAMDGLGLIGTVGFFVPAALLIALVVGAVVRDRRLHAREERLVQDAAADYAAGASADHAADSSGDTPATRRPAPPAG